MRAMLVHVLLAGTDKTQLLIKPLGLALSRQLDHFGAALLQFTDNLVHQLLSQMPSAQ